jgi:hypothetical protein
LKGGRVGLEGLRGRQTDGDHSMFACILRELSVETGVQNEAARREESLVGGGGRGGPRDSTASRPLEITLGLRADS